METLENVAKRYVNLLNRIGMEQNASSKEDIQLLFTPQCRKVVNGSLWYEGIENFLPQLLETKEKIGKWRIEALDIIPGIDERTVVVRFLVHTETAGIWNTLVILRCNDELLITEIMEIFNNYEGTS